MKVRKAMIGTIVLMAVVLILCTVLYFIQGRNPLYLEGALILVGVLNIINGVLTIKAQNKGTGILLICAGIVIIVIMIVAILI